MHAFGYGLFQVLGSPSDNSPVNEGTGPPFYLWGSQAVAEAARLKEFAEAEKSHHVLSSLVGGAGQGGLGEQERWLTRN